MPISIRDWLPSDISGATLSGWYKSDSGLDGLSDGDAVTTWKDASNNGNDLTQSTAAAKPSLETDIIALGNASVVRFDKDAFPGDNMFNTDFGGDFEPGTGDFFLALVAKFPSSGTQFVMAKANSGTQGLNLFISGSNLIFRPQTAGGTTNNINQNNAVDTNYHIIVCRRVSSIITGNFDGVAFTTDNGSKVNDGDLNNDANFHLGSTSTQGLDTDMDVAEVFVGVGTLSDADRLRIEGYLAHKYGLARSNLPSGASEHTYKGAAPTVTEIIRNYFFRNLRRKNKSKGMRMKSTIPNLN